MKIKKVNEIIGFWDEVYDHGSYREFIWKCGCKGTMMHSGDVVMIPCEDHVGVFVFFKDEILPINIRAKLLDIFFDKGKK